MKIQRAVAAAAFSLLAAAGAQAQVTVFDTAFLGPRPPGPINDGGIILYGFGRNTSVLNVQAAETGERGVPAVVPFFDTWNIGTKGVAPRGLRLQRAARRSRRQRHLHRPHFQLLRCRGGAQHHPVRHQRRRHRRAGLGQLHRAGQLPQSRTACGSTSSAFARWARPGVMGGTGVALPVPEPGTWALFGPGAGPGGRRCAATQPAAHRHPHAPVIAGG